MRILIICHYFPPEMGAPQARLSELATAWAGRGDQVTVLTGMPNHPTGVVPAAYKGRLRVREQIDGYEIVRTWLYATPNAGILRKSLGHLSFMVSSVVLGWRPTGTADVIIVSSPTFASIFSAWLLARAKRARLVVEIRDLWPAIFVELGIITNPTLVQLLERLELAAYRAADVVVVVTKGFRQDLIRRGVPPSKVFIIANGVDLSRFDPDAMAKNEVRAGLGAKPDEVLVLYAGAHGISHALVTVTQAAERLNGLPIHITLVGEGSAKVALEKRVQGLQLSNVTLLPGVGREDVPGLLAAADICLAPLRDVPLFSNFVPSKIFEYLAAGRAVIGSLRGEPASILQDAGAVVIEPENADALAGAIRDLATDPARRMTMGVAGRIYVQEHFNRRIQANRYRKLLTEICGDSSAAPGPAALL